MTQSIVCHLLDLALRKSISPRDASQLQKLILGSPRQWQSVAMDLDLNGVMPLVANRLGVSNLGDRISPSCWEQMQATVRQTRTANTFLFLTFYRIFQALAEANLHPVAGPNIVLADSLYRDPGERLLKNIDLIVPVGEIPQARSVLKSLGFSKFCHLPGSHCFYFRNSFGIVCYLQGSQAKDLSKLTAQIQPQHIQLAKLTVLEPNAMLVELIAKMSDRVSLESIADLALFWQKWGKEIEPHRLQLLMPQGNAWQCLWRAVRFLERLGQKVPRWISEAARNSNLPYKLETSKLPSLHILPSPPNYRYRLALQTRDLVLQVGK